MTSQEQKIYRAGIIGCGYIAGGPTLGGADETPLQGPMPILGTHAGVYQHHPQIRLVAAADIDEDRLSAFGRRWGVEALYRDSQEMLETEKLDIVSIAASSRVHYKLTMQLAEHPVKGLFLEKPVARTLAEADEMISACEAAGITVVVDHTRSFDPHYRAAKRLIDNGELGKLHTVMCNWRKGISFNASHLFDLLRYIVGADVQWVFCHLDDDRSELQWGPYHVSGAQLAADPGASGYVLYENGVRAYLNTCLASAEFEAVEFIGTKGRIRMGRYGPRWWKVVESQGRGVVVEWPFPAQQQPKTGMYTAVDELVRAMETGQRPASNLRDGRTVLELSIALLMSGKRGEVVKLPVTDTSFVAAALG
jgi:predicted dehydrogenase